MTPGQRPKTKGQRSKVKGQSGPLILLLGLLAACVEHTPPGQLEPPSVRADEVVAYLVASPASAPNEYVVRAIARRGVAVEEPGSFVASLRFNSRGVSFIADMSDTQAMRAVAPSDADVRVAAAAPGGLPSGELFAVRLRASRSIDLNALQLEIGELNDRSGQSLRRALVILPNVSWSGRP